MLATKIKNAPYHFTFKTKASSEIQALSKINVFRQTLPMIFDWMVVISAIVVSQIYFNPLFYIFAILIIASRQHAMLAMMHEAAHFRISKNHTLNDLLGNYLAAFPILVATEWYREHHSKHHRYLNSADDPDWSRKVHLKEWQFPQDNEQLMKTIRRQFLMGGYEWLKLMMVMSGLFPLNKLGNHRRLLTLCHKLIYYSCILAAVINFHFLTVFLLYWVVPLLVVFPALQRIRSISEHFGLQRTHELNNTRNIEANFLECALFGPHNINYHLIHHMFPSVPQNNLKKLHQHLLTYPEYHAHAHINDSYFLTSSKSLLQDLLNHDEKNQEKAEA